MTGHTLTAGPGAVATCWNSNRNALTPIPEPRVPEPAQLYSLTVVYLKLHGPSSETSQLNGRCTCCAANWPCDSARLAYRLREGF